MVAEVVILPLVSGEDSGFPGTCHKGFRKRDPKYSGFSVEPFT